jgi:hypothetical protein
MHILTVMTEKMLSQKAAKSGNWPWGRLLAASIVAVAATIVLFRQPIAGLIAQSVCAGQKLNCTFSITRLDLGGVTIKGLQVRNPRAPAAALTASRVAVDLGWKGILAPGASWIGGDDVVVRLDLSGTRPLLGDLDSAVNQFAGKGGGGGTMPRLDFKNVRVIGDTLVGPVEARGNVRASGPDAINVDLTAPPARLSFAGATLELAGGELKATVKGQDIKGRLALDLVRLDAPGSQVRDVKIEATLDQAAGVLTGKGAVTAQTIKLKEMRLASAQADAEVESGAINLSAFSPEVWLASVRKLTLLASAGEGEFSGVSWASGSLAADIGAQVDGKSGGTVNFSGQKVSSANFRIDHVEATGDVLLQTASADTGSGKKTSEALMASGRVSARGASLVGDLRTQVIDGAQAPFKAALPTFATAAARAITRASESFDVDAPWSLRVDGEGSDVSLLTGASAVAASGLKVALTASGSDAQVFTRSMRTSQPADANTPKTAAPPKTSGWHAAGSMTMSGGGAPTVTLDLARAVGDGATVSLAGAARLQTWKVGDDMLAMDAGNLSFDASADGGKAAGELSVRLDGGLGGGVWKAARASGAVDASWTPKTFTANAPRGVVVAWDEGRYGGTLIGKSALRYESRGPLAIRDGNTVTGSGTLAGFELPVSGDAFKGRGNLGPTAIAWRAEGGVRVNFDAAPARFDLVREDGVTPVLINDIVGAADLRDGWSVKASFSGGEVRDSQVTASGLKGKIDVSGQKGALNGKLTDVAMNLSDPLPKEKRRFEDATFSGAATLKGDQASFSGLLALAGSGVEIASVSGAHSLKTASGSLVAAPTPLIFRPRTFEPWMLSPLLRGPANVTGRVDVSGGASWSPKDFNANARLDLQKLGFTIASAGVFEGVSGKVEVGDLLNLKSAPGQTLTIDKVTLGLPIEKGVIRFQLIGADAIRLEGAEWPFVDGFIRIEPADFRFAANNNRIIAKAVDWNLDSIVKLFKVPDLKLDGIISGDIPVVFSTGSARIDNAVLQASQKGGVIQYGGSTGDAAAQADSNAKMLFDALKDFRYKVLTVKLDGDIAGRLVLTLGLLGRNPNVLSGAEFDLNISLDSALMSLLNTTSWQGQLNSQLKASAGGPN